MLIARTAPPSAISRRPPVARQSTIGYQPPAFALLLALAVCLLCACATEPHNTDAELGLNAQQAAGRRVFGGHCARCHYAYISRSLHGPSLHGLYKKPFMSSGIPANDDRVREIIVSGRAMMPGFSRELSQQQVDDVMAYLHTL